MSKAPHTKKPEESGGDAPSKTEDAVAGRDTNEDPRSWERDDDPTDLDHIDPVSEWQSDDPDVLDTKSPVGGDEFEVRDTSEFVDPRPTGVESKLPENPDGPGNAWDEFSVAKEPIVTYTDATRENGDYVREYADGTQIWHIDGEFGGMQENPETGEMELLTEDQVFEVVLSKPGVDVSDPALLDEIAADEAAPKTPLREAVDQHEGDKQAAADAEAANEASSGGVSDPGPDGERHTVDVGELPPLSADPGRGDVDPVEHDSTADDEGDQQFGQGDLAQPTGPDAGEGELGEAGGNGPAPDPIDYGPDHVDPTSTGSYDDTGNPDFGDGTVDAGLENAPTWSDEYDQGPELLDPAEDLSTEHLVIDI